MYPLIRKSTPSFLSHPAYLKKTSWLNICNFNGTDAYVTAVIQFLILKKFKLVTKMFILRL